MFPDYYIIMLEHSDSFLFDFKLHLVSAQRDIPVERLIWHMYDMTITQHGRYCIHPATGPRSDINLYALEKERDFFSGQVVISPGSFPAG